MLVAFPVALYVATVVSLFTHIATDDPFWFRAALWANIAGVVMAAVAAVFGLIDLVAAVPAKSRARVTGVRHAAFNVLALILFTASAITLYRNASSQFAPAPGVYELNVAAPLVLSILGLLSTGAAGWLGWTLVQTHHVGVRPTRYDTIARSPEEVDDLDELEQPKLPATYIETYRTTIRH